MGLTSVASGLGKTLWKHKFSVGMNAGFGVMSYDDSVSQGESSTYAAMGAIADIAIPTVVGGWVYAGMQVAAAVPGALVNGYEMSRDVGNSIARGDSMTFSNAQFQDSEQAQTMRQAGMSAIQQSKYNQQLCVLGNEAKYMHR